MTEGTRKILETWEPHKLVTLVEAKERMNDTLRNELRVINKRLAAFGVVVGLQNQFLTHVGVDAALANLKATYTRN